MEKYFKVFGLVGSIILVLNYSCLSFGIYEAETIIFHALNYIGSLLLALNLWYNKNYSIYYLQFSFVSL